MSTQSVPKETRSRKSRNYREKYFKGHECSLTNLSTDYDIECGRFRRFIFDLIAINFDDIRARYMFKSFASLAAEKHRHFTKYSFSIHPFSKFRFWAEFVVFLSILLLYVLEPFWMSQTIPSDADAIYQIIVGCQVVYILVNLPVNLVTGYVDGKNKQDIILDNYKIVKHYCCTWMIVDVSALLGALFEMIIHSISSHHDTHVICCWVLLLQWLVMFHYAKNIYRVWRLGTTAKTAFELILFIAAYLSWNIVLQFALEYIMEGTYQPVNPRNCSWITIGKLWDKPGEVRLMYSLVRAVGMLRKNANVNLLAYDGCFEIFNIVCFIIAQCLVLHCAFKYMLALFGSQSAKMKYYIMSQQIHTYMNQRRFPQRIKKKILKFYAIRFKSHFFVESTMLECVSGQLHEDIIMHTGRQLVREVTFLKQLPWAALIQISLKFQLTIFIEGDIIYKINTVGDLMYFISKGTVAIYTESGCELTHLEDGDHFGEIALMTKHKNRMVTAVAVTNCELFTLSAENFGIIERYRLAYDELRKQAISRVQWIKKMDDQYRAQMKDWQTNLPK